MDKAFNIFTYLKHHLNYKLAMIPECMYLRKQFKILFKSDVEWFELYINVKEEVPIDTPINYEKYVEVNEWVDAGHAGNRLDWHSHNDVLALFKSTQIVW